MMNLLGQSRCTGPFPGEAGDAIAGSVSLDLGTQ